MITNDVASDTLATLEDLENDVNIGLTTQQGEFGISDSEAATGNKIPIEPIEISRNDKEVLGRAERMRAFPGCQAAFVRF